MKDNAKARARVALAGFVIALATAAPGLARAESPPPPPPAESTYTKEGLLGSSGVRAGPTLGVGAPEGVRFGAFAKWRGLVAGGFAFAMLPELTVPGIDAQVKRVSGEMFARLHPFRGAFFFGLAGGYAQTKGTFTEQTRAFRQAQSVETHAYASAFYLAPHAGFQWMLPMGMTIGFDAGLEIPIASNGPSFDAQKYGLVLPVEGAGDLADAMTALTTMPIPVVHLLEIGWAL